MKLQAAQGEVFFEAIELKEIGEFEGADVTTAGPDFTLEVEDELAEVFERVPLGEDQGPLTLTIEMKREMLSGEFGIKRVGARDGEGIPRLRGRIHGMDFSSGIERPTGGCRGNSGRRPW